MWEATGDPCATGNVCSSVEPTKWFHRGAQLLTESAPNFAACEGAASASPSWQPPYSACNQPVASSSSHCGGGASSSEAAQRLSKLVLCCPSLLSQTPATHLLRTHCLHQAMGCGSELKPRRAVSSALLKLTMGSLQEGQPLEDAVNSHQQRALSGSRNMRSMRSMSEAQSSHLIYSEQQDAAADASSVSDWTVSGAMGSGSSETDCPTAHHCTFSKQCSTKSTASTASAISEGPELHESLEHEQHALWSSFSPDWVKAWNPQQFDLVCKLHSASRNKGGVYLMRERATRKLVSAKVMPNTWVQPSPEAFSAEYPLETEQPWSDISCFHHLDSIGFKHVPGLVGVYRDETHTTLMTNYINGGDLFDWTASLSTPVGLARESQIRPVARQLALAIKTLHEQGISHRDLSCENVLLQKSNDGLEVKIIDFCAATNRRLCTGPYGKPSYRAPEMFENEPYDCHMSDVFAFGVILYCMCFMQYPWEDTCGRGDKSVQYVRMKGFPAYMERKRLGAAGCRAAEVASPELVQLLSGLLCFDPKERLSLGEASAAAPRRSMWDEPWLQL
mmetsp:Transcript_42187/g.98973  ORF Transcript_42187/g.98973 Transcript_42187/m.98973 type:complete len:562 (+) Transcript_42187:78-1763(+)